MSIWISILIFIIVLFVLVLVHEWGHFIMAKKTGMRVDEFGIGFPPKLWGIKRGETEYTINWLPIGGFVRIYGENKEEGDIDNDRAFSARPKWAQALVLIAGVVMNILLAWFLFSVTAFIGVPTTVDESVATPAAELQVLDVIEGSPAAIIPPGAVIESISGDGMVIDEPTPSSFTELVAGVGGGELVLTYTFSDTETTVTLSPQQGLSAQEPERYIVGASLGMVETVRQPFFTAIAEGFVSTVEWLKIITVGLLTLVSQIFVGEADLSQVAGPVGIAPIVGQYASFGFTALLTFSAIISLNLAVINILPFPALDGGRLLFVAIEAVTRREIPPEWTGRVNLAGFAILLLLMIAVTYNDILRLL